MTSYLLAGPAAEPVTLAEAKAFLRVDVTAEDAFITTLITAARLHVEGTTGRALISQTWRVGLDCWPESREVVLPIAPLISISAITVFDDDGNGIDGNRDLYRFDAVGAGRFDLFVLHLARRVGDIGGAVDEGGDPGT